MWERFSASTNVTWQWLVFSAKLLAEEQNLFAVKPSDI